MGQSLSAAAVSLTVAGNEGVAPFLTLFLLGMIERSDPTILRMDPAAEAILSSWYGLVVLAVLTVLEFVAKCVPVIDEAVDAVMTFVVPFLSVAGTLSTFGLYSDDEEVEGEVEGEGGAGGRVVGMTRRLFVAEGALVAFKVAVVLVGVIFSLNMHFLKMIIRLVGQVWLTNCLAVFEAIFCTVTVLFAVFVREIAVAVAICMAISVLFAVKRRFYDPWKAGRDAEKERANAEGASGGAGAGAAAETSAETIDLESDNYGAVVEGMGGGRAKVEPSAPIMGT